MMKKELSQQEQDELFKVLKSRFENNMNRHEGLKWAEVQAKLEANPDKIWSLDEMERTGGEPDVVNFGQESNVFTFCDCSSESPKERRSVCYDNEALESRKKFKPNNSALGMASEMGIEMLTEEQYRKLQEFGDFDTKTSSWILTPDDVRSLGGAIFGDYRFGRVFIYHNGAESYYGARGFRGILKI